MIVIIGTTASLQDMIGTEAVEMIAGVVGEIAVIAVEIMIEDIENPVTHYL